MSPRNARQAMTFLVVIEGFLELSTGEILRGARFNLFSRWVLAAQFVHADSAEGAWEEKVSPPVESRSTRTVFAGVMQPAMISLLRGDSISRPTARRRGLAP